MKKYCFCLPSTTYTWNSQTLLDNLQVLEYKLFSHGDCTIFRSKKTTSLQVKNYHVFQFEGYMC